MFTGFRTGPWSRSETARAVHFAGAPSLHVFCQDVLLSRCSFVNMLFCQDVLLSRCSFVKMFFCES